MEILECAFPLCVCVCVCVADISLTGCEVRKQVRPSHVQPYPIGPAGTSGMSSDSLKSPQIAEKSQNKAELRNKESPGAGKCRGETEEIICRARNFIFGLFLRTSLNYFKGLSLAGRIDVIIDDCLSLTLTVFVAEIT